MPFWTSSSALPPAAAASASPTRQSLGLREGDQRVAVAVDQQDRRRHVPDLRQVVEALAHQDAAQAARHVLGHALDRGEGTDERQGAERLLRADVHGRPRPDGAAWSLEATHDDDVVAAEAEVVHGVVQHALGVGQDVLLRGLAVAVQAVAGVLGTEHVELVSGGYAEAGVQELAHVERVEDVFAVAVQVHEEHVLRVAGWPVERADLVFEGWRSKEQ